MTQVTQIIGILLSIALIITIFVIAYRIKLLLRENKEQSKIMKSFLMHNYEQYSMRICPNCGGVNFYKNEVPQICMVCNHDMGTEPAYGHAIARNKETGKQVEINETIIDYWRADIKKNYEVFNLPIKKDQNPYK